MTWAGQRAFADANDNHRFSRAELRASPTLLVAGNESSGAIRRTVVLLAVGVDFHH